MSSPELPVPLPWATRESPGPAADWGPPELASAWVGDPTASPMVDPVSAAYARGVEAGFVEGRARAEQELGPLRDGLATLAQQLEGEVLTVRRIAGQNLTALALVVARWLFQREVALDPTVVEALVRRAVALLPAGVPIEIQVSPGDLESLGSQFELSEPDGRSIAVHWVPDPALDRGSFRLSSPERLVDGRADLALRSLYERLAIE